MSIPEVDLAFSRVIAPLAAEDVELVDHYKQKMFGDEQPETSDAAIEIMISTGYVLDEGDYRRAVASCVGKLAGIGFGNEVLNG